MEGIERKVKLGRDTPESVGEKKKRTTLENGVEEDKRERG